MHERIKVSQPMGFSLTPAYHGKSGASWLPVHDRFADNALIVVPCDIRTEFEVASSDPSMRVSDWRRKISSVFTDLSPKALQPDAFEWSIETINRGTLSLSHIDAGPQRVHRRREDIDPSTANAFYLLVQLEGQSVAHLERDDVNLDVGDCALIDTGQPYVLEFNQNFRQLCVQLPGWWLRERLKMVAELTVGKKINLHTGSGKVLKVAMESLIADPDLRACGADERADLFMDVLGHNLVHANRLASSLSLDNNRSAQSFMIRLMDYISRNYRNETLSAVVAAQALGCSVRNVHKYCHAQQTTFGRLLNDARLNSAALALSLGNKSADRIGSIAFDCGYSDISNFCRVFRQRFGVSPMQFRVDRSLRVGKKGK